MGSKLVCNSIMYKKLENYQNHIHNDHDFSINYKNLLFDYLIAFYDCNYCTLTTVYIVYDYIVASSDDLSGVCILDD